MCCNNVSGLADGIQISMNDAFCEIEATSLYCQAVKPELVPPDELCAKLHHWNTMIFVGILTSKVKRWLKSLSCQFLAAFAIYNVLYWILSVVLHAFVPSL